MAALGFGRTRRLALTGSAAGAVAAWGAFLLLLPVAVAPDDLAAEARLAWTARLAVLPAACVLLPTLAVALARLAAGAFDPLRDPERPFQRVTQRVLSNTVEQTAVFVPALLAAATLAEPAHLGALSAATWIFVAARAAFWAGYLIDPVHRAAGMAATFNVNLGVAGYALWRLLSAD